MGTVLSQKSKEKKRRSKTNSKSLQQKGKRRYGLAFIVFGLQRFNFSAGLQDSCKEYLPIQSSASKNVGHNAKQSEKDVQPRKYSQYFLSSDVQNTN